MVRGGLRQRRDPLPASPVTFPRPARSARAPLVVVGGLPGAGKTAALRALAAEDVAPGLMVLDSALVEKSMRALVGPKVPYLWYRPMVHAAHWARIVAFILAGSRPLVVHETATRSLSRAVLHTLARLRQRPVRLVWLDVPEDVARAGQVARGRMLGARSFQRHLRRVGRRHPIDAVAASWDRVYCANRTTVLFTIISASAATYRA